MSSVCELCVAYVIICELKSACLYYLSEGSVKCVRRELTCAVLRLVLNLVRISAVDSYRFRKKNCYRPLFGIDSFI